MTERPLHYVLEADGSVRSVDVSTGDGLADWCKSWELGRRVAFTAVAPGLEVSTVFLGIDHNFGGKGPPILFETMTFNDCGDGDQRRYATWKEALAGHAEEVGRLQAIAAELGRLDWQRAKTEPKP